MKTFNIFIDGSCINNPGKGGYGIIIKYNNYYVKFSNGYYLTTNNRMELISSIISLKYIYKKSIINIYTDSLYLKNGITIWIYKWIKNNWKLKNNKKIKNIDLWKNLYNIINFHTISWNWIKKNSYLENVICDKIAKKAAKNPKLIDKCYIKKNIK